MLGQLIVLEVLERNRPSLWANDHRELWDMLVSQVKHFTRLSVHSPQADEDMRVYLSTLVERALAPPTEAARPICERMRFEADSAISELLANGGDPLAAEATLAIDAARSFYETSAIALPERLLGGVEIRAGWNDERIPHPYPADHNLGGLTVCSSRTPRTTIDLILVADGLDWRSRTATFYVLLHELISHAFVGPWDGRRAREKADPWFAEGWMDTVAFQVHNEVFEGSRSFGAYFADGLDYREDRLDSAHALYEARYVEGRDGRAYAGRKLGRDAADRVLEVFRRLPETGDDPRASLWRLSAAINTSPLPQVARRKIVQRLISSPGRLSRQADAIRALRQWAKSAPTVAEGENERAWQAILRFADAIADK